MFDWDDLRFFLAAARSKSFQEAGALVGCDRSTVARRVARLETSVKSTLFQRSAGELRLTTAGLGLLKSALEAEGVMTAAAQLTQPGIVAGTVRISSAEGFGAAFLAPFLPMLLKARPGLRIELAALAGFLSPSRREVDIAITLHVPTSTLLVVEPLTRYQLALYATQNYLDASGAPATLGELRRHSLVGYIDDLIYAPELRYLEELGAGLRPTMASASLLAQRAIIANDGGIGVLPCFMSGELVRVLADEMLIERHFWISANSERHHSAPIRAVRNWIKDTAEQNRRLLCPYDTHWTVAAD
jgi:DNA-binding transcriptional LysR family regulator